MNYGARLKSLLDKKGLKQIDFADKVGTYKGAVSRWVNSAHLDTEVIEVSCKALGIDVIEFFVDASELAKYYNINPKLLDVCRKIEQLEPDEQTIFLRHILSGLELLTVRRKQK